MLSLYPRERSGTEVQRTHDDKGTLHKLLHLIITIMLLHRNYYFPCDRTRKQHTCVCLTPKRQRGKQRMELIERVALKDIHSVQFSSVAQSCPTLCDPMNHSMPGLPVHHQLPEFTQTHAHRVGDAIQPSHSLSSPSPAATNPSQNQGLFQ